MATTPVTPNPSAIGNIVAFFIERFFGSYVTTIAGILGASATCIGAFCPFVPPHYAPYVTLLGATITAVVGALAHDGK